MAEESSAKTQFENLPDILIQKILEILHRNQADNDQLKAWLACKMLNKRFSAIAKRCDGPGWLGPPVP